MSAKLAKLPWDTPSATAPLLKEEEEPTELVAVWVPVPALDAVPLVAETVDPNPDEERGRDWETTELLKNRMLRVFTAAMYSKLLTPCLEPP